MTDKIKPREEKFHEIYRCGMAISPEFLLVFEDFPIVG